MYLFDFARRSELLLHSHSNKVAPAITQLCESTLIIDRFTMTAWQQGRLFKCDSYVQLLTSNRPSDPHLVHEKLFSFNVTLVKS